MLLFFWNGDCYSLLLPVVQCSVAVDGVLVGDVGHGELLGNVNHAVLVNQEHTVLAICGAFLSLLAGPFFFKQAEDTIAVPDIAGACAFTVAAFFIEHYVAILLLELQVELVFFAVPS